jgi:hypothetical protein
LIFSVSQQSNDLKDALDAEMEKTRLMEESMKKLDDEMSKSDELLSQMIPKQVVEKVKSGLNPIDTCEVISIWPHLKSDHVVEENVGQIPLTTTLKIDFATFKTLNNCLTIQAQGTSENRTQISENFRKPDIFVFGY